jgi:hypothetical protein
MVKTRVLKASTNMTTVQESILSYYGSTAPLLDFGRFFTFLTLYKVGTTPWTGDQRVARPLSTHKTTQTQNKRTQASIPPVEFENTTPMF